MKETGKGGWKPSTQGNGSPEAEIGINGEEKSQKM